MGQRHRHAHTGGTRLAVAAGGNVAFAVVQVAVGLAIGSVAVLADAAHQAVDAVGLVTALGSAWLVRRPADARATWGLTRADALGALVSGLLLLGSVVWITLEAVERLRAPQAVAGGAVVAIGLAAVVVNAASLRLVGHAGEHLSLRAARLHLLTDLAGSLVVVGAGAVLVAGGPGWVDPAASLVLAVAVLAATLGLLRRAGAVLLDRPPPGVEVDRVVAVLADDPLVAQVHHVHVRDLGAGRASVTAHLVVDGELGVHDAQLLVRGRAARLRDGLAVDHVTLQVECHGCDDAAHVAAP